MKPVVAIVGRANVGKSTLFNRLTEGRHAIVEDTPGVTRDRLYRDAEWLNREFTLIDTGGIEFNQADGQIAAKVYEQVELAIEEAAVIIFVVDGKAGINEDDKEIARILQKSKKPLVLAVNKLDNYGATTEHYEFFELGLGEPYPFSALHGINTGDLLDAVVAELPSQDFAEDESDRLRVTLIGRPNVGKSSLVNRLLGQDRVIVSDQPGTTRDA
ncbi:MAG: 50S ribosome-binding GTPase, partial [Clostridia bacterium]|nr:50S ribosome-binding GTPase [Clostridia bacterium]